MNTNNPMPRRQWGMTIWSWMYVLGTLGLIFLVLIKNVTVYTNNYDIRNALTWASNQPELYNASAHEIQSRIQRRFDSGYVRNIKGRDVKIKRVKEGRRLQVKYEVRKPLFYNVILLFDFDETALIPKKN